MSESTFPFGAHAETSSGRGGAGATAASPCCGRRPGRAPSCSAPAPSSCWVAVGRSDDELALPAGSCPGRGAAPCGAEAVVVVPAAVHRVGRAATPSRPATSQPKAGSGRVGRPRAARRDGCSTAASSRCRCTAPSPCRSQQQPALVGASARAGGARPGEYPITLKKSPPDDTSGITYTWTIDGKDARRLRRPSGSASTASWSSWRSRAPRTARQGGPAGRGRHAHPRRPRGDRQRAVTAASGRLLPCCVGSPPGSPTALP
jgi:hypothetical protein